jgi:hypothetical protein
MIETVQTNDGIDEQEFGYYARMEGYANLSSDMKELAKISNSPSQVKGNLNHMTGLASFNDETGENTYSIAPQPNITDVKRLHFVPTQIFNNCGGSSI